MGKEGLPPSAVSSRECGWHITAAAQSRWAAAEIQNLEHGTSLPRGSGADSGTFLLLTRSAYFLPIRQFLFSPQSKDLLIFMGKISKL